MHRREVGLGARRGRGYVCACVLRVVVAGEEEDEGMRQTAA